MPSRTSHDQRSRSRSPAWFEDRRGAREERIPKNGQRRRPSSQERQRSPGYDTRRHHSPKHNSDSRTSRSPTPEHSAPPLPNEPLPAPQPAPRHGEEPPLPDEPLPADQKANTNDDGWQPVWDQAAQAFYFYNRFTQAMQWENPRVPNAAAALPTQPPAPGLPGSQNDKAVSGSDQDEDVHPAVAGGYNPAIHGDYDPDADYAKAGTADDGNVEQNAQQDFAPGTEPSTEGYAATASFNRFTGRFNNTNIHPTHQPDAHTDESKSRRQMGAFFDVDAAANSHDGRSLREERQNRKLTKAEVRKFREKKGKRKEEKKRAWLRD